MVKEPHNHVAEEDALARAAMARRERIGGSPAEPVAADHDGLPDWLAADHAADHEREASPPEAPRAPRKAAPLPPFEEGAAAPGDDPGGDGEEPAMPTPAQGGQPAPKRRELTPEEQEHRFRMARAGFVVLDIDQEPPEGTPETSYTVARLEGGSVREPSPNWRRW